MPKKVDMSFMFLRASKFNKNINNWNVSNVNNMRGLLIALINLTNPLNNWDVQMLMI